MKILDTKMLIIHLLKKDKKTYISVHRLQKLLLYVYKELAKTKQLSDYDICFDIDHHSIEQTVLYNSHIFELDTCGDIIYLIGIENIEALAEQYKIDTIITSIINMFSDTVTV